MDKSEPRQIKLLDRANTEEGKEKKDKKEKEPKGNKIYVLLILIISVISSLIFYFFSPVSRPEINIDIQPPALDGMNDARVYQF